MAIKIMFWICMIPSALFAFLEFSGMMSVIVNKLHHHTLSELKGFLKLLTKFYKLSIDSDKNTSSPFSAVRKKQHKQDRSYRRLDFISIFFIILFIYFINPRLLGIYFLAVLLFGIPEMHYRYVKRGPNSGRCLQRYRHCLGGFEQINWTNRFYKAAYLSFSCNLFVLDLPILLVSIFYTFTWQPF